MRDVLAPAVLAWPGEEIRPCREDGANMGGDRPGKPEHVGVTRRRNKASQGGRRQQSRRLYGKNRSMLAWPGEEIRLRRKEGANTAGDRPGKIGACWRGPAKK